MAKLRNTLALFNPSGCLTLDTIFRYHADRLSKHDLQLVRKHLEECNICSDAAEGYINIPDQKKQHDLVFALRKKIRSKYSTGSMKASGRRGRRLNPTLAYISAAATILIIFGIYGIVNTDILRQENLVAEQIQEEDVESKEIINQIEEPASESELESVHETPERSDLFKSPADTKEPESPEEKIVIPAMAELAEEVTPDLGVYQAAGIEAVILEEPLDTIVIDGVSPMGGIEAVSGAGESISRKAAATPVKLESADLDAKPKRDKGDSDDSSTNNIVFALVDEMPVFSKIGYKSFDEYIRKNLTFPQNAKENGITGEVTVQFIVNVEGKVEEVKIIQGVDPLLDLEAVRVINSSPRWKPGKKNGEKVNVKLVYPVIFTE
jgi:TonB family protein